MWVCHDITVIWCKHTFKWMLALAWRVVLWDHPGPQSLLPVWGEINPVSAEGGSSWRRSCTEMTAPSHTHQPQLCLCRGSARQKKRGKDGSSAPQEMWNQHQVPQIQQVHLKVHAKTIRSCSSNTNSHTWGNVTKLGSRFKKLDLNYFCVYHHNDWRDSMMGCIN